MKSFYKKCHLHKKKINCNFKYEYVSVFLVFLGETSETDFFLLKKFNSFLKCCKPDSILHHPHVRHNCYATAPTSESY